MLAARQLSAYASAASAAHSVADELHLANKAFTQARLARHVYLGQSWSHEEGFHYLVNCCTYQDGHAEGRSVRVGSSAWLGWLRGVEGLRRGSGSGAVRGYLPRGHSLAVPQPPSFLGRATGG